MNQRGTSPLCRGKGQRSDVQTSPAWGAGFLAVVFFVAEVLLGFLFSELLVCERNDVGRCAMGRCTMLYATVYLTRCIEPGVLSPG